MLNCNLKKNRNRNSCKKSVGEAEFRLILPKKDNSGRNIKPKVLSKYIKGMNGIFGGSTTIPKTLGCYLPEGAKELYCEQGFMIAGVRDFESPYQKDKELSNLNATQRKNRLNKDYNKVTELAKKAGKELGQDSVFIESDALFDASFIKGTYKQKLNNSKITRGKVFLN